MLRIAHFTLFILSVLHDRHNPAIYTPSLHDALPIFGARRNPFWLARAMTWMARIESPPSSKKLSWRPTDRKSTRLNSSHLGISYAVFCLKKKKHDVRYIRRL